MVQTVRGSAATPTVPFAPWAHLLDEGPVDGPAALVSIALDRLRSQRNDGPLLVVIDDAHGLDELSMAMAVHVLRSPDLLVVVTTRPGVDVPGPLADVLREGRATILDVAPLDRGDLAALAATDHGPAPGAGIARHALARHPRQLRFFALELLHGGLKRAAVDLAEISGPPHGEDTVPQHACSSCWPSAATSTAHGADWSATRPCWPPSRRGVWARSRRTRSGWRRAPCAPTA